MNRRGRIVTRRLALAFVALAALVVVVIRAGVARDVRASRDRVIAGSRIVATRHGAVEFTEFGDGPPVLVIHGAGGGYDQGVILARAFGGDGMRWIVPSRFGYLRSALPEDASTAAQADAFAELLDSLGIRRASILAMSGGVPPALQFALRHPDRTAALALLSSAPYAPLTVADQKLPIPAWLYQAIFSTDAPYWLLQRIAPRQVETIFDVTPALRARLTAEEQAMVTGMVDGFQPVTGRIQGLGNEGAALDPKFEPRIGEIAAPALVVHAADDHINPVPIGEYTASHLPGAEFVLLPSGGHLLLGHHPEVRARVNEFLRRHSATGE